MVDGRYLNDFLGLRHTEKLTREQAEATLTRNIRLTRESYECVFPTLHDTDTLVIEGLEGANRLVLEAMDTVGRQIAGKDPNKPFGGMQVIATADFWRTPKLNPGSPFHGYVFQTPQWEEWFPIGQQIFFRKFWKHDLPEFSDFTMKALFGRFGKGDGKRFEELCHTARTEFVNKNGPPQHAPVPIEFSTYAAWMPPFPKQQGKMIEARRLSQVMGTQFGQHLVNTVRFHAYSDSFNVLERLSLSVGDLCRFVHTMENVSPPVLKNQVGVVKRISPQVITVECADRIVEVPPLRVALSHPNYPTISVSYQQFPLVPHKNIPTYRHCEDQHGQPVVLDPLHLTDTNDLGNVLAAIDGASKVTLVNDQRNMQMFLEREGMVNEAVNVFYEDLLWQQQQEGLVPAIELPSFLRDPSSVVLPKKKAPAADTPAAEKKKAAKATKASAKASAKEAEKASAKEAEKENEDDSAPASKARADRFCRNCKSHIAASEFFRHWKQCIEEVRWCTDCNATVPASKWEAHLEKHTIVLCIDCGRPLEWKYWERHRLTCGGMLREFSDDNAMLPDSTREAALQMGHDPSEMSNVSQIDSNRLPKSKANVAQGHKTRYIPKAKGVSR